MGRGLSVSFSRLLVHPKAEGGTTKVQPNPQHVGEILKHSESLAFMFIARKNSLLRIHWAGLPAGYFRELCFPTSAPSYILKGTFNRELPTSDGPIRFQQVEWGSRKHFSEPFYSELHAEPMVRNASLIAPSTFSGHVKLAK